MGGEFGADACAMPSSEPPANIGIARPGIGTEFPAHRENIEVTRRDDLNGRETLIERQRRCSGERSSPVRLHPPERCVRQSIGTEFLAHREKSK
jgi:hypothetical protein